MLKNFTKIYRVNSSLIGKTPASVNIKTGELYLNDDIFPNLPREQKIFVLLHELGHYKLNTRDEFKADAFAFEHYKNLGLSLKQSIYAISENLTGENAEHFERVEALSMIAKEHDALTNFVGGYTDPTDPTGNTVIVDEQTFNAMVAEYESEVTQLENEYAQLEAEIERLEAENKGIAAEIGSWEERIAEHRKTINDAVKACNGYKLSKRRNDCKQDNYDEMQRYQREIEGMSAEIGTFRNKQKANNIRKIERAQRKTQVKTARQERKAIIAEARAYKKITKSNGKSYKMMANSNANMVLAGQGIDSRGNMVQSGMMAASSIADSVSGIFGGGTGNAYGSTPQMGAAPQQNNMMLIVVVVALAAVFFLTQKKKK